MRHVRTAGGLERADHAGPVDWDRLAASWGREPATLPAAGPGRPVLDPRASFAAIRAISAPFRAGTRAGAVPDVRFYTTAGRLRAPGNRLPGPDDGDVHDYLDRMPGAAGGTGWLLAAEHPLPADFQLWASVRDLVRDLWQRVGWPALPVSAELAIGHGYPRTAGLAGPAESAGLVWVLAGRLTVRLWASTAGTVAGTDRPDCELSGVAGELLYWPAGRRVVELFTDRCMVLKLAVNGSPRAAMATVKNLLVEQVQRDPQYADREVPFLPYHPVRAGDGSVVPPEHLRAIGHRVQRFTGGPELARCLRRGWAARRSAAGLEPVPAPLAESCLEPGDRIRVTAEIVRLPEADRPAVWAVNGHLLPVGGAAGDRLWTALAAGFVAGTETSVPALRRAAGAGERDEQVLSLLRKLHRLRAIEPVPTGWS